MKEQTDKLLVKAGAYFGGEGVDYSNFDPKKFAELIVRECKENFAKVWYEQGMDIRGAELDKFLTRFEEHFGVEE
jgi:hypothetical protein